MQARDLSETRLCHQALQASGPKFVKEARALSHPFDGKSAVPPSIAGAWAGPVQVAKHRRTQLDHYNERRVLLDPAESRLLEALDPKVQQASRT
eukprot:831359-Karenia_brevis.AAC.2